jgi:hypothetical protein
LETKSLLLLVLCSLLSFTGCISIKGNFQGLTSDYKKARKECGELFFSVESGLDSRKDSSVIKVLNGIQVKNNLKGLSRIVLYIWSPHCHSKYCPNINLLREKCDSQKIKLVIVSEYFDCSKIAIFFDKNQPLIGIDSRYYKTDFKNGYLPKFMFDLTGVKGIDLSGGRFFFFENGKYISEQLTL